jgi:hypothetical protein
MNTCNIVYIDDFLLSNIIFVSHKVVVVMGRAHVLPNVLFSKGSGCILKSVHGWEECETLCFNQID